MLVFFLLLEKCTADSFSSEKENTAHTENKREGQGKKDRKEMEFRKREKIERENIARIEE